MKLYCGAHHGLKPELKKAEDWRARVNHPLFLNSQHYECPLKGCNSVVIIENEDVDKIENE